MSMTAITITSVGVLIILGRGPLLFAPAATQALYLRWLGSTLILRAYGIVILLLAAVVIWLIMHEHGTAAQLVHGFGWFFAVLCVVLLIPFPGPIGRWGRESGNDLHRCPARHGAAFGTGGRLARLVWFNPKSLI